MGADDHSEGDGEVGAAVTVDQRPPRHSRPLPRPETGDRYRYGQLLGHGGMGEVLTAFDGQLGREVAIKRIRAEAPSARTIARFLREAQIQGRLEHPAIPPVHELGSDQSGLPFFVMKKLAGTTLAAILEHRDRAAFPRQRLLRAFVEVCLAVEFAHVHGVLHRDLKPGNIMLGEFGEVYVLDWGVAKLAGEVEVFEDVRADALATSAGTVVGTPGYMAPEQARGLVDLDGRADVYALGRILGEILDDGDEVPPELTALRGLATAPDRAARAGSARVLGEQVQRFLDGDRDQALRKQRAREYLDQATAAFADQDDEVRRRETIRAAGRALALDPSLVEAASLVGHLMLVPPITTPVEVERAVTADAMRSMRRSSAMGGWALLGYLLIVPSLWSSGGVLEVSALAAAILGNAIVAVRGARGASLPPAWVLGALGATLIGVLSVLYTPLVAASVAVYSAMRHALNPFLAGARGSIILGASMTAALFVPLLASRLGWSAPMFDASADGIVLYATGLHSEVGVWFLAAVVPVLLVSIAIITGHHLRVTQASASRQLHLQAWQLRQLVTEPSSAG